MKKLLLILFVVGTAATSCKKEECGVCDYIEENTGCYNLPGQTWCNRQITPVEKGIIICGDDFQDYLDMSDWNYSKEHHRFKYDCTRSGK